MAFATLTTAAGGGTHLESRVVRRSEEERRRAMALGRHAIQTGAAQGLPHKQPQSSGTGEPTSPFGPTVYAVQVLLLQVEKYARAFGARLRSRSHGQASIVGGSVSRAT